MKSCFAPLAAAMLALLLTSPVAVAQPAPADPAAYVKIDYETTATERVVRATPLAIGAANGLPEARIEVENTTGRVRRIEYKAEWLDANGASAQTVPVWRALNLSPREKQTIVSVAQTPRAATLRLTLADAKTKPKN